MNNVLFFFPAIGIAGFINRIPHAKHAGETEVDEHAVEEAIELDELT